MHFNPITWLVLAFATTVAADEMTVVTTCPLFGACNSFNALWHSAYDNFWVNANEGCRDPSHPDMTELCMDWGNQRAHFYFAGQGKRCLRLFSSVGIGQCYGAPCTIQRWHEVTCNW
ncbi:hypothetical protein MMYC01_207442 [Madurella mycetomatis]|uniref:Secreted protein n=1 Tax=Madurella mycetomatis TaxID=100816 RepID=A0A175VX07_9PEZI|nr:hypothetical protein MMYC01_207442 [Madurella mycetomatis]